MQSETIGRVFNLRLQSGSEANVKFDSLLPIAWNNGFDVEEMFVSRGRLRYAISAGDQGNAERDVAYIGQTTDSIWR